LHHAGTGPARNRAGVLEERQLGAGVGELVAVEEVVDAGVVLVDGFGDHPQAQHARVEVDVAPCIAGDRRYVVKALELHGECSMILDPTLSRDSVSHSATMSSRAAGSQLPRRLP
jgi:hypothetical protein